LPPDQRPAERRLAAAQLPLRRANQWYTRLAQSAPHRRYLLPVSSLVEPPIVSLLEMFQSDRLEQDWAAMRALLHDESRLESLAAVGRVLLADELVEAIQTASADKVYVVKAWRVEALGQRAGIAEGRVRYRHGAGGFTDEPRVWVATERDRRIWRMRIFRNRHDAIRCFAEHGLNLEL
jgi:hypothetical protein